MDDGQQDKGFSLSQLLSPSHKIEEPLANQQDAKDQQVSVLLMVIGPKSYGVLMNLLTPDKPSDKTYTELVATLKTHFKPKSVVIAERFRFYRHL